jgi:5-methylcytosine-specific restriction endonuclease McrA
MIFLRSEKPFRYPDHSLHDIIISPSQINPNHIIMPRSYNTDRNGNSWSEPVKLAVWQKARKIPDYQEHLWRYDKCGNPMKWTEYGNRNSQHGWEIDHIMPVAHGGGDDLPNLQPLYWQNNASKGDNLDWSCK